MCKIWLKCNDALISINHSSLEMFLENTKVERYKSKDISSTDSLLIQNFLDTIKEEVQCNTKEVELEITNELRYILLLLYKGTKVYNGIKMANYISKNGRLKVSMDTVLRSS
ncbi:MAG: hypothetical protein DRG78_02325 [Epsilonproteobacteria bacterium]|nr:MAG: hypothetical protein DRG78_02325 [Campylobacterota bacterium]